jgi:hypothetical protein
MCESVDVFYGVLAAGAAATVAIGFGVTGMWALMTALAIIDRRIGL